MGNQTPVVVGWVIVGVLGASSTFGAQNEVMEEAQLEAIRRSEAPHEQYVAPPAQDQSDRAILTSEPIVDTLVVFQPVGRLRQVNVSATGLNILNDAANEPSIAVNPLNRNEIAIGWRQFDSVLNSFREAGVAFSSDGGQTWTNLPALENGTFRSDPVLNFNSDGMFFYNSLKVVNNVFDTWIFRSTDGGATWGSAIFSFGGDKQWMAVDRTGGPAHGTIYQAWNLAGNQYAPAIFNRSFDDGLTWSQPITVSGSPRFGELAVGPEGELFIAGANTANSGVLVVRSDDARDPNVATPTFPQLSVPNLGGHLVIGDGPNPVGLLGPMNIDVDFSPGREGWVYVLASVTTPSVDPLDVRFARSVDGGITWSPGRRINDDPVNSRSWHWFGTMSLAPGGRIDAVWLDTRGDPANKFSALYYSFSLDGGITWSTNIPLSVDFNHSLGYPQQDKLGDYFDMVSDDNGADLAFAATFNGEQDVYYMRINYPPCTSSARDCNANGIGDDCEVQLGLSRDSNEDSVPDECETGVCLADVDLSGVVDFSDVNAVLGNWLNDYTPDTGPGDANADGLVNFDDLNTVLGLWLQTCP